MTELFSVWFLVKILFVSGFFLYVVFAAIALRQVYLMTQTLDVGLTTTLRTIFWAHLAFSLAALVVSLAI